MRIVGLLLIWVSIAWLLLVTFVMGTWLAGGCVWTACGPGYWWAWGPAIGAAGLLALAVAGLFGHRPAVVVLEAAGWALAGGAALALLVGAFVDVSVLAAVGLPGLGIGLGSALRRRPGVPRADLRADTSP